MPCRQHMASVDRSWSAQSELTVYRWTPPDGLLRRGCPYDLQVLGWTAKRDIRDMCRDQWNWASTHPDGYGKK